VKVAQRSSHEQSKISPCPTDVRSRADKLYRRGRTVASHVMMMEEERRSWRTACQISVDIAVKDALLYSVTRQGYAKGNARRTQPITAVASRHRLVVRS